MNDTFTNEALTNYSIDAALEEKEKMMTIDLVNKSSGTTYPQVSIYSDNTLGQILEEYRTDIGITSSEKIIFENKRTGVSTCDMNETIEGLGLENGDVLAICDSGEVAGSDDLVFIDLLNGATDTCYPQAEVYKDNTLGQIIEEYADDLGINSGADKIIFTNKRTAKTTSDLSMTVEGFELCSGDVMTINDDGVVG